MNFIVNETEQKLRGGYYTPLDLARFISRWVLQARPKAILEPSCGDGVFVTAVGELIKGKASLTAFELLAEEAKKARAKSKSSTQLSATIHAQDFLAWAITQIAAGQRPYDSAIGNPPFVRYQYLPADAQAKAEAIFKLLHLPFTKHTNAWVPFVLASIALLRPGGRLGMILPAEIIHVAHAQSLRTFLGTSCSRLLIIDPEELWFDGTLQGAVILFAERKLSPSQHSDGLGIMRVSGRGFASEDPARFFNDTPRMNGRTVEGKWTRALLDASERSLLESFASHREVHRFDDIAQVDVGIVTGANKFFLVPDGVVAKYGLEEYAHPMFGRSEHCPGVIYDHKQHLHNAQAGNPTNFIWLKEEKRKFSRKVLDYIRLGENQQLHTRYKCRVRTPWYTVPSVYSTQVGMLKRAHDAPRLILNRMEAFTTDTAYRINAGTCGEEKLVYCFINSLTALTADLEGRHYGGGVLELVPTEIEKLLVPLPAKTKPQLRQLDDLVRAGPHENVLSAQDEVVLGALGMSSNDRQRVMGAWLRLRNRRQRIADVDVPEAREDP